MDLTSKVKVNNLSISGVLPTGYGKSLASIHVEYVYAAVNTRGTIDRRLLYQNMAEVYLLFY